ncbi:hypothetical protein K505DRAFT_323774 [Melanomma pulvis-pyrius CBS 109.77]|uniref:Uncharacterized protein n=1 Tax=Melanomma pulvis-pyrius CBS 109.77 TaxID=1314802 RepID=A0A6A6XHB7_9PLEO|nr:hypothetical protein K505DRAFT_323774 [Melanomma pulvis-pyrius CBS 109.77]
MTLFNASLKSRHMLCVAVYGTGSAMMHPKVSHSLIVRDRKFIELRYRQVPRELILPTLTSFNFPSHARVGTRF